MTLERAWYVVRLRLRSIFHARAVDGELDEELRYHVERLVEANLAKGLPPQEARRLALVAMNGLQVQKEACRDRRGVRLIEDLVRDLQYAWRIALKDRGTTIVAVLSLALAIGANTAIFSVVDSLLLRALPVEAPGRLAILAGGPFGDPYDQVSYAVWDQIHRRASLFDGAIAWSGPRFDLAEGGERRLVEGLYVSGDFFQTLGIKPVLGRTLTAEDDVRGGGPDGPVAVIGYGLWQQRFGGAASVIGSPLVVEHVPFTIVGVAPPEFFGLEVGRRFDVAVPVGTEALIRGKETFLDKRMNMWLKIMVRLKPGQSLAAANAALRAAQPQIREAAMFDGFPSLQKTYLSKPFTLAPAASGASLFRQQYERPLLAIFIVVAVVLLVACANVANLLLARAAARRRELSVRIAIGAGRWRVARQLLVESLFLAGLGAFAGLAVAMWGARALVAGISTATNRVSLDVSLDWRVLAFTAAVTVATAVIFGTAPALAARRIAPIDALKDQAAGRAVSRSGRFAGGLVVAELALSMMLVVAAGLFISTFERLADLPLGFDGDRVLVVGVDADRASAKPAERPTFYQRLVAAVAEVPGVAHAAASLVTPVSASAYPLIVTPADLAPTSQPVRPSMSNFITPEWFATYGMSILKGRDFDDHDVKDAPMVAIVNDAYARVFLHDRTAIGQTVTVRAGPHGEVALTTRTIVGVVGNALYGSLRSGMEPTVYVPMAQYDWPVPMVTSISLSVRSAAGSPASLAHGLAAALTAVDGRLAFSFYPLADRVNASIAPERLVAMLSGFFGVLALLLAALGLYGVTAHAVSRRRVEIGIRMALGAAPAGVVRLVLSRVAIVVGLGMAVGAGVSWWVATFVRSLLFGLAPRDPATLVGAAIVLASVALVAGWLPAWRAARIDPAEVLRQS